MDGASGAPLAANAVGNWSSVEEVGSLAHWQWGYHQ